MGLNIKNAEVEGRIRRLAQVRGVGLTQAIDQAVSAALGDEAEARRVEGVRRRRAIREIQAHVATSVTLDPRPWQVINDEMYGEFGEPV